MPLPILVAVAAPLVMGAVQAGIAKHRANKMQGDISAAQTRIDDIIRDRADVIDQSDKIRDMKSMVSNPYANLSVATQAAEMQMEQTDQALANTLDAMRATGAGAGGATALAQAAAQSKQGISASIEGQEVQNEKLRAEGQASVNQQLMNIEQMAIGEETAAFQRQDARDQALLDRAYGESDFLRSRQMQMEDASQAALMAGISGTTSLLTSGFSEGGALSEYYKNK
tara:strand:+ start:372 stop:1052 length:681 start_codon:yes stop_codon:yes gene_type:complete